MRGTILRATRQQPPTGRDGFTLIEVLLAAGLAAFVLAAGLAALRLVYATEQVSSSELTLLRTGNGLFDAMQRDLSGMFRTADAAESSDTSDLLAAADGSDQGEASAMAADVEMDFGLTVLRDRLTGAADSMTFVVDRPLRPSLERDRLLGLADVPIVASPRRSLITWSMTDEGLRRESLTAAPGGDALPLDETIDTTTRAIAFRYWNGTDWLDAWDPVAQGVEPAAVEVTLTLGEADSSEQIVMARVLTVPTARFATAETAVDTSDLEMLELGL